MLVTALLQYHQKAILVTSSASLTGLGRFPSAHIREKLNRNKTDTAMAPARITCCALCRSQSGMKSPPLASYVSSVSAMRLHQPMPDPPEENNKNDPHQFPPVKSYATTE